MTSSDENGGCPVEKVTASSSTVASGASADSTEITALLPGADWTDVGSDAVARDRATSFLRDVLQAETLVVLTGLGTSLGISSSGGRAPTMWALLEAVTHLETYESVEADLSVESKGDGSVDGNVESLLSEAILHNTLRPEDRWKAFIDEAEQTILAMCRFVLPETPLPLHERLLRAVARRSPKLPRTQIFTTNYDLAFETAASSTRTTVVDGFSWSGMPSFDGSWFDMDIVRLFPGRAAVPEPNVVHLLKLHGSVDWDQRGHRIVKADRAQQKPVLIYPAQNKYQLSYQQPYQEMMARLQMALRQPNVGLLVVGYGFHDAHINAPIESAIRSNVNLKVAAVAPNLRTAEAGSIPESIEKLIAAGDERFALIAGTFADAVELLPTLEQGDDRDEHIERISSVMDEQ